MQIGLREAMGCVCVCACEQHLQTNKTEQTMRSHRRSLWFLLVFPHSCKQTSFEQWLCSRCVWVRHSCENYRRLGMCNKGMGSGTGKEMRMRRKRKWIISAERKKMRECEIHQKWIFGLAWLWISVLLGMNNYSGEQWRCSYEFISNALYRVVCRLNSINTMQ